VASRTAFVPQAHSPRIGVRPKACTSLQSTHPGSQRNTADPLNQLPPSAFAFPWMDRDGIRRSVSLSSTARHFRNKFATRLEGDCGLQTSVPGVLWITVDLGHADLIRSFRNYVPLPTKTLSIIALVLASTIIIAGLAVWTWSDFSDFRSDAETIVAATARAMDDVARNSLQAIDGVLESVVVRMEEKGIDNLSSEAERENLRRFARRLPAMGTIVVADNAGNIVAAVPSLRSPLNVSDQEWFRSLKEGRAEPHVGRALKGDMVHGPFFSVARWVRRPDGAFNGGVQVGVGLTYFAQVFRSLDVAFRSLDVRSDAKLGVYRTE